MRILLATLLLAATVLGQDKPQTPAAQTPAQGPPPKNLTKLPDGHFSANSDPKNVENFEIRVVLAGDTLSAIAREFLNDGKLWPQIWEQNEHVVNPHWIYPNDKILIRPVTKISDAKPPELQPEPQPEAAAPAPAPKDLRLRGQLRVAPYPSSLPPAGPRVILDLTPPRIFPEVKESDLFCSGFIRPDEVSRDLKVIGSYGTEVLPVSTGEYLYIGKGVEDSVRPGTTYEVIRPTRNVTSPNLATAEKNLGMHYLEIAQVQIVIGQAEFALGRVTQGCDIVELGDILVPYTKADFPALPSKRPFSGTMKGSGMTPGNIVMTKHTLTNAGSKFGTNTLVPGARSGSLKSLDRGIAAEGTVVYLDIGKSAGVKPGDFFIVFRDVELKDGSRVTGREIREKAKTAIGEVVVLKVEERASTALVTYSDDVIVLGDVVERR